MSKDYGDDIDWDNWEYDPNDDGTGSSTSNSTDDEEEEMVVKDANGNILQEGDTVAAIKNLPVKGGQDIKRGDKFHKIRLTDDEGLIESGKMVLKTEFFRVSK